MWKDSIVFPGSFDPWTYWHEAVLTDYLEINPNWKVEILIWVNPAKNTTFSSEERKFLIEKTIPNYIRNKVEVIIFEWAVADYVYENSKTWILKWARDSKDFEYEKDIAIASKMFSWNVKTLIIPQLDQAKNSISSSSLKAISKLSWDIASLASPFVRESLRMKQNWKFLIAVTWWIASWKSTFCKEISEFSKQKDLKINYINLDQITACIHTRTDLEIFVDIRQKIAQKFWKNVLNSDWTTNKKILWDIVFSSKEKMEDLMNIILELMIHLLRKEIDKQSDNSIILVEWAIIFERKLTYLFDENIINIWVSKSEQIKRIKSRDNLNNEQIENRLLNQLTREERVKWIKETQKNHFNRLFLDINTKNISIEDVYNKLLDEYDSRKELKKKWN